MSTDPTIRTLVPRATREELEAAAASFTELGYRPFTQPEQGPEGWTMKIINDEPDPPETIVVVREGLHVRKNHDGSFVIYGQPGGGCLGDTSVPLYAQVNQFISTVEV